VSHFRPRTNQQGTIAVREVFIGYHDDTCPSIVSAQKDKNLTIEQVKALFSMLVFPFLNIQDFNK